MSSSEHAASYDDDLDGATPLSADEAAAIIGDTPLITATAGSIPDMKVLRDKCLAAGIPVLIGCPGGGGSCGPKTHLLVPEAELPRIAALFQADWASELERQGLAPVRVVASELEDPDAELPCPACGTAAPLVDGACSDCGIMLET